MQMTEKNFNDNIDIFLMSDNCIETVGGEQESTKIIINGIKDHFSLGVVQPGEIKNPIKGVHYYLMTHKTRIKHLIKNPFAFINYILNVRKIIRTAKPKIIHTQSQVSFFIIALLRKFFLISKDSIFIHTERGLYTKYNSLFKNLFLFFMRELSVLVTTTNLNMSYWKSAISERNIELEYKIIENTAGELFETYNENNNKTKSHALTIGFAGRYADWKNWPLAVDISTKLNKRLKDKLYVKMAVGCLDEKAKKETIKMFQNLSSTLGDRFEGKINISLEEMDKFHYEIDVFILTSEKDTESFGRTLVEAMSRKTVVLTTDAGGPEEIVRNKESICRTTDEFVTKVLELHSNREKMRVEKELNMLRVKEKYSFNSNISKHMKLYNGLIKSQRKKIKEEIL